MSTKYAILAVDPEQYRYYVPCGMSARLWALAGFRPAVMKFGPQTGWEAPLARRALAEMVACGATIRDIDLFRVPPWSDNQRFHCITASRRLAAALWYDPGSYVVLGDADMLLLNPDYLQLAPDKSLHVWGVDMYQHPEDLAPGALPRWPACYQGATSRVWREIMRPACIDVAHATYIHMDRTKEFADLHYGGKWNCEPGMHAELHVWPGAPDAIQMVRRREKGHQHGGRLYIRERLCPQDPIDCHIRNDWRSPNDWDLFLSRSPRIPAPVKAALCRYRDDCLNIIRNTGLST